MGNRLDGEKNPIGREKGCRGMPQSDRGVVAVSYQLSGLSLQPSTISLSEGLGEVVAATRADR